MAGHKPWSEIKHKRDIVEERPPNQENVDRIKAELEPKAADAPTTDSDDSTLSAPADMRKTPGVAAREREEDRRDTPRGEDRRAEIEREPVTTHWSRKEADIEHAKLSTRYAGRSSGGHRIRYRVRKRKGFHLKRWGVYSS